MDKLEQAAYDFMNNWETIEPLNDIINKPKHYHKGGIDVIGFAKLHFPKEQVKGFLRINALKYLDRYEDKGGIDDLKKCQFYLNELIGMEEDNG
jgi:hypothetical protein